MHSRFCALHSVQTVFRHKPGEIVARSVSEGRGQDFVLWNGFKIPGLHSRSLAYASGCYLWECPPLCPSAPLPLSFARWVDGTRQG